MTRQNSQGRGTTDAGGQPAGNNQASLYLAESERAILGCVMRGGSQVLDDVTEILSADAFYVNQHRVVYEAVIDLYDTDSPIDITSVAARLEEQGRLDAVGGRSQLVELVEAIGGSTSAALSHAKKIREKWLLRRFGDAARRIIELTSQPDAELEAVCEEAETSIHSISHGHYGSQAFELAKVLPGVIDNINEAQAGRLVKSTTMTGFADLDRHLHGFSPGNLVVIAGRPSMGKTQLAVQIAEHLAVEKSLSVVLVSLEMTKEELAIRFLASMSGVVPEKFMQADGLSDAEWDRLLQAKARLSLAPLLIDEADSMTPGKLRSRIRRYHRKHRNLRLVIVDYLQLMSGGKNVENRTQEVSVISRGLKSLAKECGIVIVALSQLSRGVESRTNKRPELSDLRESGAIEQDADIVAMLYREGYYEEQKCESPWKTEVLIRKARNGRTGVVNLRWNRDVARFEDLSYREETR